MGIEFSDIVFGLYIEAIASYTEWWNTISVMEAKHKQRMYISSCSSTVIVTEKNAQGRAKIDEGKVKLNWDVCLKIAHFMHLKTFSTWKFRGSNFLKYTIIFLYKNIYSIKFYIMSHINVSSINNNNNAVDDDDNVISVIKLAHKFIHLVIIYKLW